MWQTSVLPSNEFFCPECKNLKDPNLPVCECCSLGKEIIIDKWCDEFSAWVDSLTQYLLSVGIKLEEYEYKKGFLPLEKWFEKHEDFTVISIEILSL